MPLYNPINEAQIPAPIARDAEYIAADTAHVNATDPHLQYPTQARGDARYVRHLNFFDEVIPGPVSLRANAWQELGTARVVGEQGKGAFWDILVYFQYTDTAGGIPQAYFQYCGAGVLGVIFWQADFLVSQGVELAIETHNDPDFTARIRFGRGQARKLEIYPSRDINILDPGFLQIQGTRRKIGGS